MASHVELVSSFLKITFCTGFVYKDIVSFRDITASIQLFAVCRVYVVFKHLNEECFKKGMYVYVVSVVMAQSTKSLLEAFSDLYEPEWAGYKEYGTAINVRTLLF